MKCPVCGEEAKQDCVTELAVLSSAHSMLAEAHCQAHKNSDSVLAALSCLGSKWS